MVFVMREEGNALGDRLGAGPAKILLVVPGVVADLVQEAAALGRIGDELAVEVLRVPADQHVAEVENHRSIAKIDPPLARFSRLCASYRLPPGNTRARRLRRDEEAAHHPRHPAAARRWGGAAWWFYFRTDPNAPPPSPPLPELTQLTIPIRADDSLTISVVKDARFKGISTSASP